MGCILIFAGLTALFLVIGKATDWDYFIPVIGGLISGICLVAALISIPLSKQDDIDFALKVASYRKTLVTQRQMSEYERVAIAKDVLELNASMKQRQFWLHSKWYSVYHEPCIDTLKPLE